MEYGLGHEGVGGRPAASVCKGTEINANWGMKGPPELNGAYDDFSVRWSATKSFSAGLYRFMATSDDGCRLHVDGVEVMENWRGEHEDGNYTADVKLAAGDHSIVFESHDELDEAFASLRWRFMPTPTTAAPTMNLTVNATAEVSVGGANETTDTGDAAVDDASEYADANDSDAAGTDANVTEAAGAESKGEAGEGAASDSEGVASEGAASEGDEDAAQQITDMPAAMRAMLARFVGQGLLGAGDCCHADADCSKDLLCDAGHHTCSRQCSLHTDCPVEPKTMLTGEPHGECDGYDTKVRITAEPRTM